MRSKRQFMEHITYNMMARLFVCRSMAAPVWDMAVFSKNGDRLLEGDIACVCQRALLAYQQVKPLLSEGTSRWTAP